MLRCGLFVQMDSHFDSNSRQPFHFLNQSLTSPAQCAGVVGCIQTLAGKTRSVYRYRYRNYQSRALRTQDFSLGLLSRHAAHGALESVREPGKLTAPTARSIPHGAKPHVLSTENRKGVQRVVKKSSWLLLGISVRLQPHEKASNYKGASGRSRPCVSEITPIFIATSPPQAACAGPYNRAARRQ